MNPPSAEPIPTSTPKQGRGVLNMVLRLLVGGTFVFAAVVKMADPAQFALAVANYRLVPHEFENLVAILIPSIELVAGLCVLAGVWLRAAALVIMALTTLFLFVIISALVRGLNIECGCFGTIGGRHIGLVSLGIDATFFLLATILVARSKPAPAGKILDAPVSPS